MEQWIISGGIRENKKGDPNHNTKIRLEADNVHEAIQLAHKEIKREFSHVTGETFIVYAVTHEEHGKTENEKHLRIEMYKKHMG